MRDGVGLYDDTLEVVQGFLHNSENIRLLCTLPCALILTQQEVGGLHADAQCSATRLADTCRSKGIPCQKYHSRAPIGRGCRTRNGKQQGKNHLPLQLFRVVHILEGKRVHEMLLAVPLQSSAIGDRYSAWLQVPEGCTLPSGEHWTPSLC